MGAFVKLNFNSLVKYISVMFLLGMGISCGNHSSTEDTVKKDRERAQTKSDSIYTEYSTISGNYHGSNEIGDFLLQLKPAWNAELNENHIPTPIILGTLSFFPNVNITGAEPVQMAYPISNGNYMKNTGDLTLNIGTSENLTQMSCHQKSSEELNCDWFSPRGKLNLTFKQLVQEKSIVPLRTQGVYKAETDEYFIEATFRSFYSSSNESQISKIQISGEFAFISKKSEALKNYKTIFKSNDGILDPFTNILSFNIPGDNQITVNCKFISKTNLDCQWISIHSLGFVLIEENSGLQENSQTKLIPSLEAASAKDEKTKQTEVKKPVKKSTPKRKVKKDSNL